MSFVLTPSNIGKIQESDNTTRLVLQNLQFQQCNWQNCSININSSKLNHFRYADGMVLIVSNRLKPHVKRPRRESSIYWFVDER